MSGTCPTDDGQMRTNTNASTECEGEYRKRVPNANNGEPSPGREAVMESGLVFDLGDLLGSLERMLRSHEWKNHGTMWRMRAKSGNEHKRALKNALDDYFARTPIERQKIKNRGAWLTDKYERCLKEIQNAK